jgi:hypothetical protein
MSQMLVDADVAESFRALKGPTPIVDPSGRILGFFQPGEVAPPGVAAALSPNSIERLQELRKQREGGLPLAEVLKRIGAQ